MGKRAVRMFNNGAGKPAKTASVSRVIPLNLVTSQYKKLANQIQLAGERRENLSIHEYSGAITTWLELQLVIATYIRTYQVRDRLKACRSRVGSLSSEPSGPGLPFLLVFLLKCVIIGVAKLLQPAKTAS